MAVGERVTADGISYVVVWDGGPKSPSLLDDYPRPSSLASIIREERRCANSHDLALAAIKKSRREGHVKGLQTR
jgi:hypothetical protein